MTTATSVLDLAESARRRARIAGALGRLVAEEPNHDVGVLVGAVPELAALADPTPALAATFERLLVREVPLYESVFTSADGQRGGAAVAALVELFDERELGARPSWRVAGPDHLGIELWAYGALCAEESQGWEDDRIDRAARAVEAERAFLGAHLATWAEVATGALARRAAGTPYLPLIDAVQTFVAAETEQLRPAPDLPGFPPVEVAQPPRRIAPGVLARWLLAPSRCGTYLDADDLAGAARTLGIPWRASDPRSRFREVVVAATDSGDLPTLLASLRDRIEECRDTHARNEAERPGNQRTWRAWRLRADETLRLLDRASVSPARAITTQPDTGPIALTVLGGSHVQRARVAAAVVEQLRSLELVVAVSSELAGPIADEMQALVDAGLDDVLLVSKVMSAALVRDGGGRTERELRHQPDAGIIVRIGVGEGPLLVDIEARGDVALRDRVRDRLVDLPESAELQSSSTVEVAP